MSRGIDVLAELDELRLEFATTPTSLTECRAAVAELIEAVQRVDEVLVDRKGHEFLEAYGFTFHNLQRALSRVRGAE